MADKVEVVVGYTKGGASSPDYKWWERENLRGVDIRVVDGLGNKIQLNARENRIAGSLVGFRIWVNDKEINLNQSEEDWVVRVLRELAEAQDVGP